MMITDKINQLYSAGGPAWEASHRSGVLVEIGGLKISTWYTCTHNHIIYLISNIYYRCQYKMQKIMNFQILVLQLWDMLETNFKITKNNIHFIDKTGWSVLCGYKLEDVDSGQTKHQGGRGFLYKVFYCYVCIIQLCFMQTSRIR